MNALQKIGHFVTSAEDTAVDFVARSSPWLAPLPTAYLTATATVKYLAWPTLMGIIAGVVSESLGLASVATALELREYNATKRKSDPRAPFKLAVALGSVYFTSVTGLTVLLDTSPQLAIFAPLVFPVMSLAGVTVLALRADHERRLAAVKTDKAERKAQRQALRKNEYVRQATVAKPSRVTRRKAKRDARLDALLTIYRDNPDISPTKAGQVVGVSRQTIYAYLTDLEASGRISRDNGLIKVVV